MNWEKLEDNVFTWTGRVILVVFLFILVKLLWLFFGSIL